MDTGFAQKVCVDNKLEHANEAIKKEHALRYLQTQVFHAQSDPKTIQYVIDLFGKTEVTRYNKTFSKSKGKNSGSTWSSGASGDGATSSYGGSFGRSQSETEGYNESVTIEDSLFASQITSLKTGSQYDGISEAFLFQTGRHWSNGTTILKSEFNRKLL